MTAIDDLESMGIAYEVVHYGPVRTAEQAAAARGIELEQLVKTLVVRRGDDDYIFVLITGNCAIDWKMLRAALGVRRLTMPSPEEAQHATGYKRGTITPLGASHRWPVLADVRVAELQMISLGSGEHGRAINVDATALLDALDATVVAVAAPQ